MPVSEGQELTDNSSDIEMSKDNSEEPGLVETADLVVKIRMAPFLDKDAYFVSNKPRDEEKTISVGSNLNTRVDAIFSKDINPFS